MTNPAEVHARILEKGNKNRATPRVATLPTGVGPG